MTSRVLQNRTLSIGPSSGLTENPSLERHGQPQEIFRACVHRRRSSVNNASGDSDLAVDEPSGTQVRTFLRMTTHDEIIDIVVCL